ncbi:MAG: Chloroplast import component protein (Tic20) [Parcubacteria bacterium OLB19]|nr:MAG: Chloroplast import component protein (Tic20) [Parcubacteria bacterium OLB19]
MENNQNNEQNQNTVTPTPQTTEQFKKESDYIFDETTIMASISYLGPLVLVPLLTKRENQFVMFHVKQGLVLFGIWIASLFILMITLGILAPITGLINFGLLILSIIGILNALKMKEVEVPITGKLASKISL